MGLGDLIGIVSQSRVGFQKSENSKTLFCRSPWSAALQTVDLQSCEGEAGVLLHYLCCDWLEQWEDPATCYPTERNKPCLQVTVYQCEKEPEVMMPVCEGAVGRMECLPCRHLECLFQMTLFQSIQLGPFHSKHSKH